MNRIAAIAAAKLNSVVVLMLKYCARRLTIAKCNAKISVNGLYFPLS